MNVSFKTLHDIAFKARAGKAKSIRSIAYHISLFDNKRKPEALKRTNNETKN